MFGKRKEPAHVEFDARVKTYLIYLAYVKNSITLSIAQKSDFMNAAQSIAHDVFVSMEKLKAAKVNAFNVREIEATLEGLVKRLDRLVIDQMKLIERLIFIDKAKTHSVSEAVESIVLSGPNLVCLSQDHIDRLFAISRYVNPPTKPIDVKKETAKANKAFDDEMNRIGYKAFEGMLQAGEGTAENPEAYYRAIVALNEKLSESPVGLVRREDFVSGFAFLESEPGRFIAASRDESLCIELVYRIIVDNDRFSVGLDGRIDDDGPGERFSIDKRYFSSSEGSVVNALRLRPLLDAQAKLRGDRSGRDA